MKNKLEIWRNRLTNGVFIVILLLAIRGVYRQYLVNRQVSEILASKEQVLSQELQKNQGLKEKLVEIEKPDFIEKQAYEKLGLVKVGSDILEKLNQEEPIIDLQLEEEKTEQIPNWKRWWELFF